MFTPLGTPALITAFQTVISTPNKGQASIISSSSFKHFTSLFPFMFTCMAVRHTLVWRTVYFPHSTQTCRNSVLFIGGAMPQSTPLQHPNPPRPHSPSPAIFLLRCTHLNLNPSCSEVEVFSWERICLSLPPQDTLQCLEISELTSTEDSHALLVLSVSLRSGAVVSLCPPPATHIPHMIRLAQARPGG